MLGEQHDAVRDLLESMLSPLDRRLALAPLDDGPLTPEDRGKSSKLSPRSNTTAAVMERVGQTNDRPTPEQIE